VLTAECSGVSIGHGPTVRITDFHSIGQWRSKGLQYWPAIAITLSIGLDGTARPKTLLTGSLGQTTPMRVACNAWHNIDSSHVL